MRKGVKGGPVMRVTNTFTCTSHRNSSRLCDKGLESPILMTSKSPFLHVKRYQ